MGEVTFSEVLMDDDQGKQPGDGLGRVGESGSRSDGADPEGSSELSRRQAARDEVLVEVLARGVSYADAAARAGCSSKTVGRRMVDPSFRARVEERRSLWVSQTSGELTALGPAAVEVLRDLLVHSEASLRLRSARELLSQGFRSRQLHDLDLEVREIRAQLEQLRVGGCGEGVADGQ